MDVRLFLGKYIMNMSDLDDKRRELMKKTPNALVDDDPEHALSVLWKSAESFVPNRHARAAAMRVEAEIKRLRREVEELKKNREHVNDNRITIDLASKAIHMARMRMMTSDEIDWMFSTLNKQLKMNSMCPPCDETPFCSKMECDKCWMLATKRDSR